MLQGYDRDAARAAILFVAQRVAEPTFHKIGKIFYFADREHLATYGRLMFGETYKAARHGPLPSKSHNDLTAVRQSKVSPEQEGYRVAQQQVRGSPGLAPVVQPLVSPDIEDLSGSAIRCLEKAIELYGDRTFVELCEASHGSVWEALRKDIRDVNEAPVMGLEDIAQTIDNDTKILIDHLHSINDAEFTEVGVAG